VRSVYRDLAKTLSLLLIWLGIGWIFFPTLVLTISQALNEPFDKSRAELITYPLSISCFTIAALLFQFGRVTLPVEEDYFKKKTEKRTYKCPFCGKKIRVEETNCPYCKTRIPR